MTSLFLITEWSSALLARSIANEQLSEYHGESAWGRSTVGCLMYIICALLITPMSFDLWLPALSISNELFLML